jgi:antirestriction protein ArdC
VPTCPRRAQRHSARPHCPSRCECRLATRSRWKPSASATSPSVWRPAPRAPIETAEAFFASTGATFQHGGNRAFYAPSRDVIQLPPPEAFRDAESYAAIKAHDLIHWTGHPSRTEREFGKRFGDTAYAREELVAELGAAFLCADLAITLEPRDDHAAYLADWLSVLKDDKRAIFSAAAHDRAATGNSIGCATGRGSVRRHAPRCGTSRHRGWERSTRTLRAFR